MEDTTITLLNWKWLIAILGLMFGIWKLTEIIILLIKR